MTASRASSNPGNHSLLPALVIAAAALVGSAWVLPNGFVRWDDDKTIFENPAFNPPRWEMIAEYWTRPAGHVYIPVTYTVWGIAAEIAHGNLGLSPAVFHVASLLAHATAAVLAYLILLRIVARPWPACAGALLFALHPAQVEPVAWASGLKDVLAGMFSLAALHQYILFRNLSRGAGFQPASPTARNLPRPIHYIAGVLFFILAMLSKPSAVATPLLCLAYDLFSARSWRSTSLAVLPWLVLAMPFILIGQFAQPASEVPFVPYHLRPLVALDALSFYLAKLLWPVKLAVDYGRTPAAALGDSWLWLRCAQPVVLGTILWFHRRRTPAIALAGCLFALPLLPVLGLIPFDMQLHSTVADHYLYVAMLGPGLLAAWGLNHLRAPILTVATAAAVLLACAVLSARQFRHWRDSFSLWQHNLAVNPNSPVANRTLGYLWAAAGDDGRAIAYYQTAARVGDHWLNQFNWGNLMFRQGRYNEAIDHYTTALRYNDREVDLYLALGVSLARSGRFAEAVRCYQKALQLDGNNIAAQRGLAAAARDVARAATMP